ncbi:hypothetical protein TorRG33x02_134510 [Trema orientale]|uniref:Uncharacterized protein n=1 Tax=Trema orientale TaxID=63057 RepID=A0A2P5EZ51_TREOI|nr:hypothetical protein TorRG33x02_134510 [Trema orientale]
MEKPFDPSVPNCVLEHRAHECPVSPKLCFRAPSARVARDGGQRIRSRRQVLIPNCSCCFFSTAKRSEFTIFDQVCVFGTDIV